MKQKAYDTKRPGPGPLRVFVASVILIALGLPLCWLFESPPTGSQRQAAPANVQAAVNSGLSPTEREPRWIQVKYSGLVDLRQLTQSGETIGATIAEGVKESYQRGQLQPFLEPFSNLLPQALDMTEGGTNRMPRTSVLDELPAGSPQPAWAALLTGGRFVVTDDGNDLASVFVPGNDAKQAFGSNYGVIRNILEALAPSGGKPLRVRVYAYQNDYASCELKLCVDPFELEETDFPPPPGKTSLDLNSLQEFFDQGVELTGGAIDPKNNLVLVGKKSAKQTLASKPVSLADLAVAFRAVFYSGDDQAFISLDTNSNPTLVNVNFGGHLEDTRIGAVVLAADERFKTITSGLDPTSFVDRRSDIRADVPDFATVSERELTTPFDGDTEWQGTRFWYYPDSVDIEASLDYREAAVVSAQFTADAERSRSDFGSSAEFERARKSQLSPAIRMNINDLNQNYAQYAAIFPELRELSAVARLMGICIWLKKANLAQLDLDELLTVEIPPVQTPRTKKQLVTVSKIVYEDSESLDLAAIESRSVVRYITPLLDSKVSEAFPTDEILAKYLAEANGDDEKQAPAYLTQAQLFRQVHGDENVSEIISDGRRLQAFASAVGTTVEGSSPPEIAEMNENLSLEKAEIDQMKAKLKEISSVMDNGSDEVYNSHVAEYNELADKTEQAVDKYNSDVDLLNSKSESSQESLEISGGIGLESERFNVRQSGVSPILEETKRVAEMTEVSSVINGEKWVRSKPSSLPQPQNHLKLNRLWSEGEHHQTGDTRFYSASDNGTGHYWRSANVDSGRWKDENSRANTTTERVYDPASRTLQVAKFENGKLQGCIVGKFDGQASITFETSPRKEIMSPQQPPNWWQ